MFHELGVLELEGQEFEVGKQGMTDKNFASFGWFFLDGVFKVVVVGFFVGWEFLKVLDHLFAILRWDDLEGWVLVFQELEHFLVGFDKVESCLGSGGDEFNLDRGGATLDFLGFVSTGGSDTRGWFRGHHGVEGSHG
jgi:hypothetical protein